MNMNEILKFIVLLVNTYICWTSLLIVGNRLGGGTEKLTHKSIYFYFTSKFENCKNIVLIQKMFYNNILAVMKNA